MVRTVIGVITNHRMKYVVLLFWLVVVAVSAPLAGKLTGAQQNDARTWLPGSAESTQALDRQAAFASPDTIPAVIVYERPSGLTPADLEKVKADAATYARIPSLDGEVVGPVPSADGQAAQILVPLNLGPDGWNKAADEVAAMTDTATAGANGLNAYVTGPAGFAADSAEAFEGIDSTLLLGTIAVVVVILLFTYRSPVLWILPVISAGVALICAQAVIYLLAEYAGLVVNAQSAGILTVLVFGAGTDYALLLVARYREELRRHHDRHEAMAVALHRAGPAIIASGATVVVSMLCLLFAVTNSTKGLGPVAAIGVLVALAVMLTLLPALLVTVGRWVFWPTRPQEGSAEPTASGFWARVGATIAHAPRMTWIVTSLVLITMGLGITQLDASGLTNKESFIGTPQSVAGEEVLARHFPAGSGSPVAIVSRADQATRSAPAVAVDRGHRPRDVTPPVVKGDTAYVQATLTDPPDSQAAYDTVDRLRERGTRDTRRRRPGRWQHRDQPRRATRGATRPQPDHPDHPAGGVGHPGLAAAGGPRPAAVGGDGRAVVRGRLRRQRARLQVRLRLRRRRHVVPALRLRVPRRVGHRLQHLPDDPRTRGGATARHETRRARSVSPRRAV